MKKQIGIFTIYFYELIDPYWGVYSEDKMFEIGFGRWNLIVDWSKE